MAQRTFPQERFRGGFDNGHNAGGGGGSGGGGAKPALRKGAKMGGGKTTCHAVRI